MGRGGGRMACAAVLVACAALLAGAAGASARPAPTPSGSWWHPPQQLSWYWQLTGAVSNSHAVAAYDIDGFETSAGEVASLHALGRHVICYVDVGTAESWRPDYRAFPKYVLGRPDEGWPGERWLDIRRIDVIGPIMRARFRMCAEKGFDAVEPDNIEAYANRSGFPLTAADQLRFDEWVAEAVHALGMAVLQKNDAEQSGQLAPYFDGALDEQCNQYRECSLFAPYLQSGRPVLDAEYQLSPQRFCPPDRAAGIMGARFDLSLDGRVFKPCW